jgi:hypothetical protein
VFGEHGGRGKRVVGERWSVVCSHGALNGVGCDDGGVGELGVVRCESGEDSLT